MLLTESPLYQRGIQIRSQEDAIEKREALDIALTRVRCQADSTDEQIERAESEYEQAIAEWHSQHDHLWPADEMEKVRQKLAAEKKLFNDWLNGASTIAQPLPPGTPMPNSYVQLPVATWKSATDLLRKEFAPVQYVVPKYLAEGCTLLAGRPKIGKSWLTEDMALAVARGGEVLGERVVQGDVLLLALEDNERRLQSRFRKILGPFIDAPAGLTYATEWPRVDEGGLERIRAWIDSVANPRLIVVDVLARVRSQQTGRQAQYEADYQAIAGLQAIASEKRVAIVVVHHLRKTGSDSGDAIDKISGTLGLSGAADSVLILDRDGQGVQLYARGRDIEEIEMAISFDKGICRWTVLGQAGEIRRSDERKAILDALRGADGRSMTPAEVALATGMTANAVRQLLFKMNKKGEVERAGGGYIPVIPDTPSNADNSNAPRQHVIEQPALPPLPALSPLPPLPPLPPLSGV